MLQEDYIMRVFQQFNEMLAKWLNKKRFDNVELVVSFNDEVVKPFLKEGIAFFERLSFDQTMDYFTQTYADANEKTARLEILAESLYQKGQLIADSEQKKKNCLLALEILKWIDKNDSTFSLLRQERIAELNQICG